MLFKMSGLEPGQLVEWLHVYERQTHEVQQLMEIAPDCPELPDLLCTIRQAIDTAISMLEGPEDPGTCALNGSTFTVECSPIPMDLSALPPSKIAQHITAIQQRAAMLGSGPPEWAVGAKCQAREGNEGKWRRAVIEGISPSGRYLVEWLPSAREACFEVDLADLRLVPPIAGAFWTPLQPPPYDSTLPLYPVTYSDSEKQAQREACVKECQGLKDAIAAGKSGYTFPPGVYRSREKIKVEGTKDFTLTLANVEIVSEVAGGFFLLYENRNLTIRGPLALDAEPFRFSQCEVTSSDGETYLELRPMPGYEAPTADGKFLVFDARGRMFPTGQVWPQGIEEVGDGRFRMKLDKDTLSIPGLAKSGNYLTMHGGPGGFEVNQNHGVTIEHVRGYCGGEVSGPQGDSRDRFINMRGMRRPGTNRLFSGVRYFQVWYEGGSFMMDRCEVAYNDDDLSDIFTWLGVSVANASSGCCHVLSSGPGWAPGHELTFYNCHTLETVGVARLKSREECRDKAALEELNKALKAAGMPEKHLNGFWIYELDQAVEISSLTIIDSREGKAQRMSVTNSYFHDGLNCGINLRGAQEVLIANSHAERTRTGGVVAMEDFWWGEGGFPGDVVLRNNTVHHAYYQKDEGAAICAFATGLDDHPSGCPIRSARVVGNFAADLHGPAISVTQCADVTVCGNLPAEHLSSSYSDTSITTE